MLLIVFVLLGSILIEKKDFIKLNLINWQKKKDLFSRKKLKNNFDFKCECF